MPSSHRRPRGRAQAAAAERGRDATPLWLFLMLAAGLLAAGAARGQVPPVPAVDPPNTVVPEIVAPTIPPGAGGSGTDTPQPRSENPLSPTPSAPTPDRGIVVQPPATGDTPVIRPPATGDMPVIRPPGSPGSGSAVVPK